ncbi:MAG: RNase adapter RapZ [Acidiferrobacterales bacterium]|nr:RNase adapter RapZ [Acidiferrobacterales bacterium]
MKLRATDLIIVSGMSGSGKSVALQSLEDIGYYCIDNLPAVLLPEFNQYLPDHTSDGDDEIAGAAVSIDARNNQFLDDLDQTLDKLEQQGRACRILFIDAEESILLRRYSETRRKHPLTGGSTPLIEGMRQERKLLQPLRDRAEKVFDTTETTPHQLRAQVRDFAGGSSVDGPLILVESFGFKHGSPREADFIFDVRCLPNPHWEEHLRPLTGLDQPVAEYLENQPMVMEMTEEIFRFLRKWLPGFASENRSYITVAIGCTGGQHRSVYICEQVVKRFLQEDIGAQVRHRQLEMQSRD